MDRKWERIHNTRNYKSESQVNKEVANKSVLKNEIFLKACEYSGIKATTRQASKWNNQKGLAYKNKSIV